MKKIFILFITLVSVVSFSGCNIYIDTSKRDMELIDVKVFDSDGNEVEGSYKNFRTELWESNKLNLSTKKNSDLMLLNSAAPVENYYYVNAYKDKSYTVKFTFHSANGYDLTKVDINNDPEADTNGVTLECENIEKINKDYVATFDVEKMVETAKSIKYYHAIRWYGKSKQGTFGNKGSNIYIKGVCFNYNVPTTF